MSNDEMKARIRKFVKPGPGGCWLWTGYIAPNGYGSIQVNRSGRGAHRAAYEAWVAPIPKGLHIDHLCRVRHCVNPEHLEAVTCRENINRGDTGENYRSLRQCLRGHPFDEVNTYAYKGRRECRACRADYQRRLRRRVKERSVSAGAAQNT